MFFQSYEPAYTSLKTKTNWNKIKATRYEVYQKSAGGKTTRAGQVGHGGSYPTISLETIVRKKEDKYIIDTFTGTSEALDEAYAELTELTIPETIEVNNFNMDTYFPVIGDRLQVQDQEERVLKTIIDCDNSSGWTNASSDATDYCEGSGSLSFSSSSSGDAMYYDFGVAEYFRYPERVGFMIKASEIGTYLELGMSNYSSTLFNTTSPVPIYTAAVWQYKDFPTSSGFRYIGLNTSSAVGATSTVKIDQVSMYLWDRKIFEGNIVKAKIKITAENDRLCNITLTEYDEEANADKIEIMKQVDIINTVNQST
jgi:uncharacterized protein involved in tolerance to divalent cations